MDFLAYFQHAATLLAIEIKSILIKMKVSLLLFNKAIVFYLSSGQHINRGILSGVGLLKE